jgi:uncharacterized integral membrane protein
MPPPTGAQKPYLSTKIQITPEEAGRFTGTPVPEADPNRIDVTGPCPRCEETTSQSFRVKELLGVIEESVTRTPPQPIDRPAAMTCACNSRHPKAQGKVGCGASWLVVLNWEPSHPNLVRIKAGTLSDADLKEEEAVQALAKSELQRVRAAAEKYQAGLAGLFALIATVTVIKGQESIHDLDLWAQLLIGLLILSALAAAVTGALMAMRAAFGPLDMQPITGRPNELIDWQQVEVATAIDKVRSARRLTIASVALIGAAIVVTWLPKAAASSSIKVVTAAETICGSLKDGSQGKLAIQVAPGNVKNVSLTDVQSLSIVADCNQ